ncbi:uncharacterized protein LOC110709095 [Chenopodium quinoa]|uniref:uncharacterized protein LOC110709095 n=1 Tax=Chenopodium quinoa TaxID=63459 RepID=UPI000B78B57F|nr:uncharacterized protein LOC110709095 [Chenopodium quinoa]
MEDLPDLMAKLKGITIARDVPNHLGNDCDEYLVVCRFCNKKGHREFECFSILKQQRNGNKSTFSFISRSVVKQLGLVEPNPIDLPIRLPTGEDLRCTKMHKGLPLRIGETDFPSNLIKFELGDLDVILGINWLDTYKDKIDCEMQKIHLRSPLGNIVSYSRFGKPKGIKIISAMKLSKLVSKGYPLFFCCVQELEKSNKVNVKDMPIVNDFLDVFPKEILGLPPKRELEFTIDLVPGTTPISKAPYRMAPAEMGELKVRLQELLDKGYIRPSASL